jgi:hypothetical protein
MVLSLIVSAWVCGALILIGVVGYLLDKSAERHDQSNGGTPARRDTVERS